MDRRYPLNNLHFDNDRFLDNYIRTVTAIQMDFSIDNRHRFLAFYSEPKLSQFECKARLIRRLQQSRSQSAMNLNCSANDTISNLIESIFLFHLCDLSVLGGKKPPRTAGIPSSLLHEDANAFFV